MLLPAVASHGVIKSAFTPQAPSPWFALLMGSGLICHTGRMGDYRSRMPAVGRLWASTYLDAVSAHGDRHMSVSLLAFFVVYTSVFGRRLQLYGAPD